jgi:hypothetical protein
LAIISCPGCGRGGLRIPDGRRGKVTCPTCGAEWLYPETVEINELEFRCAHSGARFIVQLARRSPLHKFVIQGVRDAPGPTSKASNEAASDSISTEANSEMAMIPSRRSKAPQLSRPGGLLSFPPRHGSHLRLVLAPRSSKLPRYRLTLSRLPLRLLAQGQKALGPAVKRKLNRIDRNPLRATDATESGSVHKDQSAMRARAAQEP